MAEFHSLKVADIYKETSDTSVVTFEVPTTLQEKFAYTAGQHLTLLTTIAGEEIRRSYSLCTSPLEKQWKVAVKQVPNGKCSTYINQKVEPGTVLKVMEPTGTFGVHTQPNSAKNYLFFAAGSGITPIISMIKTYLATQPKATCKLFYTNKTAKSIIFKEELEQLRNTYFGRLEIYYFLTQERRDIDLFNGRLDEEKMKILIQYFIDIPDTNEVFLCGPEQMVKFVRDYLVHAGLPKSLIHYELFVIGLSEADIKRAERLAKQNVEGTKITIVDGGKEFNFTMTKDFDNILDAALHAGADLPYACKGGVCSTCKCKVIEGTVEMKINYALEEKEVKQNYVLSCQAVPKTKAITVDFDV